MLSASLYTAHLFCDRCDTPFNFTRFLMARMTLNDLEKINSKKTVAATSLNYLSGAPLSAKMPEKNRQRLKKMMHPKKRRNMMDMTTDCQ
jgi:hypothetical protein